MEFIETKIPINQSIVCCLNTEGWHVPTGTFLEGVTIRPSRQQRDKWLEEERLQGPDDIDTDDQN